MAKIFLESIIKNMYPIRMISTVIIKIEIPGSVKYWIFILKFKLYFYLNCPTRRSGWKSYNDYSVLWQ